jgi:splicing factor U2AF subunit
MPVQTFGMGIGSNPNLSRQSRRLYIGSITTDVNEQNLADFFNEKMTEMNIGTGGPGNPVLAVQCNYEKSYAFVEVRAEEVLYCRSPSNIVTVPVCRRRHCCNGL